LLKFNVFFFNFIVHKTLNRTHSLLKVRSVFVDEKNNLKIWDFWMKDLFDHDISTLTNLEDAELDSKHKDMNFAILLLRKMLLGNESIKESKLYEDWPESLQNLIEKITDNKMTTIEDFLVNFEDIFFYNISFF